MNIAKLLVAGSATVAAVALAGCGNLDNASAPASSSNSSPVPPPSSPAPSSAAPTASPPTETDQPSAPTSSTDCKAADLKLSLGQGDTGAGTTHRPLQFTNKSDRTCEIQGYPGVSYVTGDSGQMVGAPAVRVGTKGAPIKLSPGKTVSADIGFTQVANFEPSTCKQTAVRGLRVYPPHDTASMFVPLDGNGCTGKIPGHQLTVDTVK